MTVEITRVGVERSYCNGQHRAILAEVDADAAYFCATLAGDERFVRFALPDGFTLFVALRTTPPKRPWHIRARQKVADWLEELSLRICP